MIDTDKLMERLRERLTEPRDDYGLGECLNCRATLTAADVENDACSQCGSGIESDEEHLHDN